MARRNVGSVWLLVAALLVGAFAACSEDKSASPSGSAPVSGSAAPSASKALPHDGKWGKGIYIGPEFTLARAVTGHRVHVVANKIECAKCHSPTENSIGPPVKPERCAACHEKEARLEHGKPAAEKRLGAGVKTDCTTCHAFAFDGKRDDEAARRADALLAPVDGGTGPTSPHGIEQFAPGDCKHCHAEKQGDTPGVVSHLTQPCLECHKPHEQQTPTSAPCSDCHKDVATTHASQGKTIQETCSTCHQNMHEPAKAALTTCTTCHATHEPIVPATALFAGGHAECTSCHKPHEFDKSKAVGCGGCHAGKPVIGGAQIAAHNTCTNCHSPHNVKGSPGAACGNCHKNVHPDHPKTAGGCTGCHDAHPQTAGASASACSSCHKAAHSDQDFHRGVACEKCHKPHDFKLTLGNVGTCELCHSQRVHQVGMNTGHQVCTNCHKGLPHRPEPNEIGCATCHGKEHAFLTKGHDSCTQCHEPHSGAQSNACGNCHKDEHRTAPQGHQACTNCHEPHGGKAEKACSTCHAGHAKTPHGLIGTGCTTCHRPHGPTGANGPPGPAAVPACTGCHKLAALPGLHAETKHQSCTTCHSGHGDLPGTMRTTCLNCHKDRANHFPDGQRCANCHLFTKTK